MGVSVGVGATGVGHHGGQFGVAQGRQGAGQTGHQKRQDNTGTGDFNTNAGDDENAGPDDLDNANDQEVEAGGGRRCRVQGRQALPGRAYRGVCGAPVFPK